MTTETRLLMLFSASLFLYSASGRAQSSACDLAAPSGTVDAADVQVAINMSLGITPCTANIAGAGVCNVAVVQRVINASLPGGNCITGLGAVPHAVTLSWTASVSAGVSGYNIYRKTGATGYVKINTSLVAGVGYMDTTVVAGNPDPNYYYVVRAVDGTGKESTDSNMATATIPTP
jgi:hypothetical protein